jgi:hypothetical protein
MAGERPETIYDLLRAIVDRTGWRTGAEEIRYRELLAKLEATAALGTLASEITTTKEAQSVDRENVRQMRDHLLGEG